MGRGMMVLDWNGTMPAHLGRKIRPREWFYSFAFHQRAIAMLHSTQTSKNLDPMD
jgi:hypothetical protein